MSATTYRRAGGLLIAVVVLLTGCDGADQERLPTLEERVTFEEVAVPESLVSTSRRVGRWSVVPQSGDLPRLAVATVAHGRADEADVGVWQAATGVDPLSEQGEIPVPGDVDTARVASDGALTAIAGAPQSTGCHGPSSSPPPTARPGRRPISSRKLPPSHVAVRTERYVGPVLWLSADARQWPWVPSPVSTRAPSISRRGRDR